MRIRAGSVRGVLSPGGLPLAAAVDQAKTLLHYRILERLGEGGMGVVYRAEDTRMGRTVALKLLRRDLAADEDWSRRFEREVRVASSFSHPGIATLYDFQQDGDACFYTMEYVEGHNLREILKTQGPLPLSDLTGCALQVAEALAEAHRKGIVHRDLKPENVMESASGYYKILDFGLARYAATALATPGTGSALETRPQDATQAGQIVGTVAYMSPEQAQGAAVDARSDIFAFGSLFYELATGASPFKRKNAIATFHAIVHEPVRPLQELRPELPRELEWILARCLAKDPGDRYQEASQLAEDLRVLHYGSESGSRRISAIRGYPGANVARSWQIWGTSSRRWAAATWGTITVILALIAGRLWLFPPEPAARTPAESAAGAPAPADLAAAAHPGQPESLRSVAVSPFVNSTGDPGADWLVDGLPEMITTSLAGVGDLSLISTHRLRDLMTMAGRDGKGGVDGSTATELARWAGASIVISGSIYRTDEGYRIDSQAYDTATGQVLAASRVQGGDVFDLADRITGELAAGLLPARGETAIAEIPEPPSAGKAPEAGAGPGGRAAPAAAREAGKLEHPVSPEAYRLYVSGMGHYNDLRFAEGAEAFKQALDVDPGFAPAQMRLGMSLVMAGEEKPGAEWIHRAADQARALSEKERRIVHIVENLYVARDAKAAEREAQEFAKVFPEDQEGWYWLARGRAEVEGDQAEAMRILSRVVREEPDNLPAVASLGRHMAMMGGQDEAIRILRDYQKQYPRAAESFERIIEELEAGRAQALSGPEATAPPEPAEP